MSKRLLFKRKDSCSLSTEQVKDNCSQIRMEDNKRLLFKRKASSIKNINNDDER